MNNRIVKCGRLNISNVSPFTLIAGPCQLENEKHAIDVATKLKEITQKLKIGLIYKTSFDKANRTSLKGKRGAGLDKSLPVFDKIRKDVGIPVLTDVHTSEQFRIVHRTLRTTLRSDDYAFCKIYRIVIHCQKSPHNDHLLLRLLCYNQ